ncbi:MAG TPA: helix-turn-helix domain-containing protein [Clostridiaceae bacterium]|nr:helix-turn-helix domain-containing protein [Clostridiaceae bacterium]
MAMTQPPPIGRNIISLRKQKNMSLDELAKRSGVSKSMLSQIEQDKTNPTVITAWKIARALDISIQELMESGPANIIEVIRSDDAPVIFSDDKSCIIKINSPIHTTDNLELYQMIFKPHGKNASMPHFPKAEEFLTVISGKLKVTAGDHSTLLNKGDTARYRGDVEHVIENVLDEISEAYLVVWFPK